jgi:hypothetical protein
MSVSAASEARRLLSGLDQSSTGLRAAAVFGPGGEQLAATDDADWSARAAVLWSAADQGSEDPATQVHVGTEQGEVFAMRGHGASIVATSDRFALASLMMCDLRAVLRGLEAGAS